MTQTAPGTANNKSTISVLTESLTSALKQYRDIFPAQKIDNEMTENDGQSIQRVETIEEGQIDTNKTSKQTRDKTATNKLLTKRGKSQYKTSQSTNTSKQTDHIRRWHNNDTGNS